MFLSHLVLNLSVSVHLADNNHHRTPIHRECLSRYALTIQVASRNSIYDPRVLRLAEVLARLHFAAAVLHGH